MHVLFLAPDTHVYNHGFLEGLKSVGARVSAIGPAPKVSPAAAALLDGYTKCDRLLDGDALLASARQLGDVNFDRVETIDEPMVEAAASLRQALGAPGLTPETARLCRDKVAMKEFLIGHDVPCAQTIRAVNAEDALAFGERCGYPLILKPIAGFGSLQTWRVNSTSELEDLLARTPISEERPLAVEEFVEGHEGFYDTITDGDGIRHEFAAHYFPGCLEATLDRTIAPQIAVTNRVDDDGYTELQALARRVVDVLGIRGSATHMEWFFGPKGLKFSEIGARPAGEKIWDMYKFANEFDVYREWALASLGRPSEQSPSRKYAAGSIQIRPDRDGRFTRHDGLEQAWQQCRPWIYEYAVPKIGDPTLPLDKGWLVNTWFRLRHEDYDELRKLMTFLGQTVHSFAR